MKFKKKKTWISPEAYGRILSLLLSPNDEDFEIGVALCEAQKIKPTRLFNQNSKEVIDSDWDFKMKSGRVTRRKKYRGYETFMSSMPLFIKDPQIFTGVFTNRIKI